MAQDPRPLRSPKGFSKAFLKARWWGGGHAQVSDWLIVTKQVGVTRVNTSVLRLQEAWDCVHVVN